MKKILFLFLSTLFISSAAFASNYVASALAVPPHAGYLEMKTPHFFVIFPKKNESDAALVAHHLEKAYDVLTPFIDYSPKRRTTVVVTDHLDFANGVASALGHQGLFIFLAPPEPYSSIGQYGDWLESLVFHEYTHYLILDQTHGIFNGLRILLGDLILPNQFWPSWLNEGLAVYIESIFTQQGRGHGDYFSTLTRDGIYRRILGTRDFLTYDQLSGTRPDFPFGGTAYYAGFGIVDQLVKTFGKESIGKLAHVGSERVPYFLDGTLQKLGTQNWFSLWNRWVFEEEVRMAPELNWLKAHATKDPTFVSHEKDSAIGARLSPDAKKIAYVLNSGHERAGIHLFDLENKKDVELIRAVASPGLSWSADGNKLYYSHSDYSGPYALISDLYEYDLDEDTQTRLTWDEHAKDPGYCPNTFDGDSLVYVVHSGRTSALKKLDVKTRHSEILFTAPKNHHMSNPRCTRDGKFIYFSYHDTQPNEAIYSISIQGGAPKKLFGGSGTSFRALFPEPASDGNIYFTKGMNKFFELARYSPKTKQITTLAKASGGYWMPSIEQNRIAVSYVSSLGIRAGYYELSEIEHIKTNFNNTPKATTPKVDQFSATRKARPSTELKAETSNYRFYQSLAPRIWFPTVTIASLRAEIGAAVFGWDDLDQFNYQLSAHYNTLSKNLGGLAETTHRIYTFNLGLFGESRFAGFSLSKSGEVAQTVEERRAGVILSRPLPGVFSQFIPSIQTEWARTYFNGTTGTSTIVGPPEIRYGANLAWSNMERYPHSLAAERGHFVKINGRRYTVKQDTDSWKGLLQWNAIVPFYGPRHSTLSFNSYFAATSAISNTAPQTAVLVGGSGKGSYLNPPLRGYGLESIETTRAAILQTEYRVPFAQLFEGSGHFPLFFENLGAYVFFDAATIQEASNDHYSDIIGGYGGGLIFNTLIGYNIPFQLRLELASGTRPQFGGENTVTLLLGMAPSF